MIVELAPEQPVPEEFDDDLRSLVIRIQGFLYLSDSMNTVIKTVGVLRANPEFAKRLLGLAEQGN